MFARKLILILILLPLSLAACVTTAPATEALNPSPPAPSATPFPLTPTPEPEPQFRTFTDDLGRSVTLAGPAQAIVTLGPSVVESLFAIGAGGQVVGREEFSTYPEEALTIPSIGSLFGELPAEAILALEPDLIIAPEIISPEQVQALEDLGLAVFWQANPKDFPSLYANLLELGELTGQEAKAQALIDSLSARVQAVEDRLAGLTTRPTVFFELDATDPENPYTVGSGTFIDTLIVQAGGENIGAILEGEYAQISSEEILLQDPDIILLGDAPYGVSPESVAARAGWQQLSAVQKDQVYPFDPFLVSVPGPRLVDGLEAMAALLHPDRFE